MNLWDRIKNKIKGEPPLNTVAKPRKKTKQKEDKTNELLISMNNTLKHSDYLISVNIMIFAFFTTEIILLTIADTLGDLTHGLFLPLLNYTISGIYLPFILLIPSAAFAFLIGKIVENRGRPLFR